MDSPKISIIVPIYNVEKYLHRCIDSILSQTFVDFEVLLIDDGSPDNSGKICEEYATKDSRIQVFHKTNQGVSSARQLGIEQAKGEYSIHVDGDDWIEYDMLENLYKTAINEHAKMVLCDFSTYNKRKLSVINQKPTSLFSDDVICNILTGKLTGSTCNKLIKHSLYKEYNILFPKDINYCEDAYVIIKILLNIEIISYLSKSYYNYVIHSQSITRKPSKIIFEQNMHFISELQKILPVDNQKIQNAFFATKVTTKKYMIYSQLYKYKEIKYIYPECKIPISYFIQTYLKNIIKSLFNIFTHYK
jgi:glycosyltransferase involved in cell wall biosynthesis